MAAQDWAQRDVLHGRRKQEHFILQGGDRQLGFSQAGAGALERIHSMLNCVIGLSAPHPTHKVYHVIRCVIATKEQEIEASWLPRDIVPVSRCPAKL